MKYKAFELHVAWYKTLDHFCLSEKLPIHVYERVSLQVTLWPKHKKELFSLNLVVF
jgi:hypothetical protein